MREGGHEMITGREEKENQSPATQICIHFLGGFLSNLDVLLNI